MEQVYNSMLYMAQAAAERPAGKPAQTQERDSFQKLMDQKQQAAGKNDQANGKAETAVQDQPQEGQAVTAEDPQELEKQMVLAAMAAMQNLVIPAAEADVPAEAAELSDIGLDPASARQDGLGQLISHEPTGQAAAELRENGQNLPEDGGEIMAEDAPKVRYEAQTFNANAGGEDREITGHVLSKPVEGAEQDSDAADTPEEGMAEAPVFRDVREIPVKVGEAPVTENTREVPVENQIGDKLTEALAAGETRVEIQLTPENLGKVTVEVTLHEDGALHIALHAENSQTRSLLERSADSLMVMLGREARQEVQVEVPRQQESQQQNFYEGQQGHEHQGRQQQERRQERQSGEDFLHQLRLGLIPGDGETA